MANTTKVSLMDMVECIVESLKLANSTLHEHSVITSRIAYSIGRSYGLKGEQLRDLVACSLLHCVGTLVNNFEFNKEKYQIKMNNAYSRSLHKILSKCCRLENISKIFERNLSKDNDKEFSEDVCVKGDIVRLSCNTAKRIDMEENALVQKDRILKDVINDCTTIREDVVNAFHDATKKDYFWLHSVNPSFNISFVRSKKIREHDIILTTAEVCSFATIIAYMIDFKSPNTINHSYGVAVTSYYLGILCGLTDEECEKLKIAGYVHDIGKLGVPDKVLYKPSKLNQVEFTYIKKHPYDTYRVLERVKGLEDVRDWASYHHEKPNGKGYPFNIYAQDLPIQCRILTIADVFSALREDRMYRKRFPKEKVIYELKKMFSECQKDIEIVKLLVKNYEKIELARMVAEADSYNQYADLMKATGVKIDVNVTCAAEPKAKYSS